MAAKLADRSQAHKQAALTPVEKKPATVTHRGGLLFVVSFNPPERGEAPRPSSAAANALKAK